MVRRELSDNYCFYVPNYDTIDACYDWAKETLNKHRTDPREHVYTLYVPSTPYRNPFMAWIQHYTMEQSKAQWAAFLGFFQAAPQVLAKQ